MSRLPTPETCAQCGADIPPGAHACPECGADERTGWRETSIYDGLDLPETDAEADSPARKHSSRTGLAWYWWLVAVVLLLLLVAAFTGLR
jgi:hypothetical protein